MKKILLLTMMAFNIVFVFAYDFEVGGIYYNIISESNLTVEVTYKDYYKQYHTYNGAGSYDDDHCGYYCEYKGNIVIPANVDFSGKTYTVTRIGNNAFATNTWALRNTQSNIYDGITDMNLKSIVIPETVVEIGSAAFQRCKALTRIVLPSSLISIGNNAFEGCTFYLLKIPSTVTSIGETPFPKELKELIMLSYLPPIGGAPFGSTNAEIWVPSKNKYLNNTTWGGYNIIEMLTPSQSEFTYNGNEQTVNWSNNLSGYSMNTPVITLQKNAGNYSADVKAEFKGNDLAFSVEFPFEYSIIKAILNVKVNDASRVYGDDAPSFNLTYSGFVNGEDESVITQAPIISTSATKESNVGEYPITVNGGEAANYEFVYAPGALTVTKAPLSAKINDATKVYGAQNPVFTISYNGLKNEEIEPAWTTRPTFITGASQSSGVGQYEVTAQKGTPVNYDLGEITAGTLTILPAPLSIMANDATRHYYNNDPQFSYTCNGFVNGEDESVLTTKPQLTTTASLSSDVGTYAISVSGAESPNYSISFVNGTLTITKKTLMASVGNYVRKYNEENPAFEVKYDGFAGNDNEKVFISKPQAKTTATKSSNVGTYTIEISGGDADNYQFSYTPGMLTINKAEQKIYWQQYLNSLKVGDQVELKAVSTSGLPITYTMEGTNKSEVYSTGKRSYLDCKEEGSFVIKAVQAGNSNYYSSARNSKNVVIGPIDSTVEQRMYADVNGDGDVDAADIVVITNIIMEK